MQNITVTQQGVTRSQPGTSVSYTTGTEIEGAILSVTRHYYNSDGTHRKTMKLEGYGKQFRTSAEANEWALDRGYLAIYRPSPELRAWRKKHPIDFKKVTKRA